MYQRKLNGEKMRDRLQDNMDDYLPLRDVVFKTLRQGILTGEIKPGERLMEIHLGKRLGVSRTPIREAIRKLELEGLVVMIPRKGAQVAEISQKHLKDVLEVRRSLDSLAVELACERMSPGQMEDLKEACNEFEKVTKTKDVTAIAKADVALHDVIVRATGNERLEQLISNLAEQVYRYRFEYIKDASYHERLIKEHEEIFESILAKDKIRAKELVVQHIDNQELTIIKHLKFREHK